MSGITFLVWTEWCPVCQKVTQHECCGYEKMSADRCNVCFTSFPNNVEDDDPDDQQT